MATDIDPASGNTMRHLSLAPSKEPGERVDGECKYLHEFASPQKKTYMHRKEEIAKNLFAVSNLLW
jgi:hypothetical protein